MDILKGNIKSIYFKYLIAAFGGTLIPCIYSVVDVAMVGKYHGPSGPAALAVFAPLWNVIYGLGLLAVLVALYCLVQCVDQMKRMFTEAMKYLRHLYF